MAISSASSSTLPLVVRLRQAYERLGTGFALISFILLFVFFAAAAPNFLSPLALSNIVSFASVSGLVVLGVALLMIAGEFDLSVGAMLAVGGFLFAELLNAGVTAEGALLLTLLACAVLGVINGLIVITSGIPSFIATLGTMLAYRGIARVLGGGDFAKYTGPTPVLFNLLNGSLNEFNQLFQPAGNFRAVIIWFVVLASLAALGLHRARFGNWIFATGGNYDAARAQGVPVRLVKVACFALAALLAGFAGVLQFTQGGSIDPLRGEGLELIVVVACVIGGLQLTGGVGSVFGAVIGILTLHMLEQGLVLMGVSVQVFRAIVGFVLVVSVVFTTSLSRLE